MRAVSTALFDSEVCTLLVTFGRKNHINVDNMLYSTLLRSITKNYWQVKGIRVTYHHMLVYIIHIDRGEQQEHAAEQGDP